jgi:hypothetical protein
MSFWAPPMEKRGFALRQEQELSVGVLAEEGTDQTQLVALQAMDAWRAVLGPLDVDGRGLQVELLDPHVDELACP